MLAAYVLLFLISVVVIIFSMNIFTFYCIYYPDSKKEYKDALKKIKDVNTKNIDSYNKNLKYCLFKITGGIVVNNQNKLSFSIKLLSPYDTFLYEQKKYPNIKMANWKQDRKSWYNYESDEPPPGNKSLKDINKSTEKRIKTELSEPTQNIDIPSTTPFIIV